MANNKEKQKLKEEIDKKWHDKLFNAQGKTQSELDQELNELWKENNDVETMHELRVIRKLKSAKQTIRNYYVEDSTSQEDINRFPIDGDLIEGSRIFMRACASCHSLETKKDTFQRGGGPSLAMIYGRPAASWTQYDNYSQILLQQKLVWNKWNLYRWVNDPQAMAPGTTCMKETKGVQSISDRTDLVFFLRQFSKTMAIYMKRELGRTTSPQQREYMEFGKKLATDEYRRRSEIYEKHEDPVLRKEKELEKTAYIPKKEENQKIFNKKDQ